MGPSGSGKSTLLNMLGGIDSPDGGELRIGRSHLEQMGEGARARLAGTQHGHRLPVLQSAADAECGENIELPLLLKPLKRKERRARVETVMDLVGLSGRQRQFPSSMSGGQQQRVGIARAIVCDPDLFSATSLPAISTGNPPTDILEMLGFLNQELRKTIVMVTHDPEAASFARRTLHLNKGEFVEQERSAQ